MVNSNFVKVCETKYDKQCKTEYVKECHQEQEQVIFFKHLFGSYNIWWIRTGYLQNWLVYYNFQWILKHILKLMHVDSPAPLG